MVFSSITFLFVFLPITLFLYYIGKNITYRNVILLIFSLLFYAWGEPVYVVLMLLSILFNYYIGRDLGQKRSKGTLIFGVVFNLLMIGYFKYAGLLVDSVYQLTGVALKIRKVALPVGISFYTFQAMSYVIDVYRGNCKAQEKFVPFAAYITMFPQLIAGPIVKYTDIEVQLAQRKIRKSEFREGVFIFIRGLAKKVILANCIGKLHETVIGHFQMSVLTAWIGAIAYTIQIFNDFSGYSDMAIGLGKMLGFEFCINFDRPYSALSVTDFWRRWHISLSTWFREYVYIPLGGNRVSKAKHIRNLLVVWMLTGLWHGAAWHFVLWGLYYGVLLILEKTVFGRIQEKLPKMLRRLMTLFIVIIGWVLFFSPSLQDALTYIGAMFGTGGTLVDNDGLFYLCGYGLLMIVGFLPAMIRFERKRRANSVVRWIIYLGLFVISVACLVSESYNPFLYFRF